VSRETAERLRPAGADAEPLGDGLVLRTATPADIPGLVAMHTAEDGDPTAGAERSEAQLRDLLERPHPTFSGRDMTLVEETASGRIVSAQHFSEHTWAYGGVRFPVGEVEHVATHPAYRRRGLIRAQTAVMHRWAEERGCLAIAINGIPWFYAQFGYELALERWSGGHLVRGAIPPLADGVAEPYDLRPAAAADLPFIEAVYDWARRRYLVSYVREPRHWRYDLDGRAPSNPWHRRLFVIASGSGERVGFLSFDPHRLAVDAYELAEGVPWLAVTPSVARAVDRLAAEGEGAGAARRPRLNFGWLGSAHPAFRACPSLFAPVPWEAAWYVRLPDLPAFLRRIAPALEGHLARSAAAGYSGALGISFYRDGGVRLAFERGRLGSVEPWAGARAYKPYLPTPPGEATAWFPDLIFYQLLFGYRSLADLEHAFVYRVGATEPARALLEALFPTQPSYILPVY
jgi:GNAT superfamily N-acetyltransferase